MNLYLYYLYIKSYLINKLVKFKIKKLILILNIMNAINI